MHSGCAISGVVWLLAFTAQATKEFVLKGKVKYFGQVQKTMRLLANFQTSVATVAITYFILVLLVGIVLFAYPRNRSVHHDAFERTHRFLGWSATGLVWCQACESVSSAPRNADRTHRLSC